MIPFALPADLEAFLRWLGVDITSLDFLAALEWEQVYFECIEEGIW